MQEEIIQDNERYTKTMPSPDEQRKANGLEAFTYKVGNVVFDGWRKVVAPFTPKKHSHKRENERRRRQIAKGMLQVTKK